MTAPLGFQSTSLYVGDLKPEVNEAVLFETFNAVGPVASIRVCRDAITRRSLGYSYVNFHNPVDADRALDTMNYAPIRDRPCRIMWSQRDPAVRRSGTGNVFIKSLDKEIDNKALYDTFSAFGNILSCKVVEGETGSKGYGFVHFETQDAADQAIAKVNGMLLNNKKVFVGHFVPKKDRADPKGGANVSFTNVFVKNLPENFSEDSLRALFSKFGTITSAAVLSDSTTGVARFFGFVCFDNTEAAQEAVQAMNGAEVLGKTIFAGRAQTKQERNEEIRLNKNEKASKYQGVNLFIKNLDEGIDDDRLLQEFSPFGSITSHKVMRDEKGNSKGFAFVCFSAPEEASKAVSDMNGRLMASKPLYVAFAQTSEERKSQLAQQYAQRNPSLRMHGVPPMYYPGMMYPGMNVPRPRWAPSMPPQFLGMAPAQQARPRPSQKASQTGAAQPTQRRTFKYAANVRNQPQGGASSNAGPGPQNMMNVAAIPPSMPTQEPLTTSMLAMAPPEQQKQMLGERLYPIIHHTQGDLAGKITGMLLEMDNGELLHLLESREALNQKVQEAVVVLQHHQQVQATLSEGAK